jgi:hypothetical protein
MKASFMAVSRTSADQWTNVTLAKWSPSTRYQSPHSVGSNDNPERNIEALPPREEASPHRLNSLSKEKPTSFNLDLDASA